VGPGSPAQLAEHTLQLRLQPALLGSGQVLGDAEAFEPPQRTLDVRQRLLELDQAKGEQLDGRGRPDHPERVPQQLLAVGFICSPVGIDQRRRLPVLQPVPIDGAQQCLLVLAGQPGQRRGQARPDLPPGETGAAGRGQVAPDGHPALDPGRPPSKQRAHARSGQLVVVQQGADDASLVRRSQEAVVLDPDMEAGADELFGPQGCAGLRLEPAGTDQLEQPTHRHRTRSGCGVDRIRAEEGAW